MFPFYRHIGDICPETAGILAQLSESYDRITGCLRGEGMWFTLFFGDGNRLQCGSRACNSLFEPNKCFFE